MSQPPQPPNQPPQGGFGAPQPSYGYPQQPPGTPPPQPGYGYPQAPGQAPQTPPPGAPQTPPPPPPGAPQTPPPPPGAPQTPPPGAGGYGYPAQGQPGYPQPTHAQPTQIGMPAQPAPGQPVHAQATQIGMPAAQPYGTGQQPGYAGYPAQPQTTGNGPAGGGGKSKQRMTIIVSAVVAVALAIGAGVFFLTRDDGKKDEAKHDGSSQGATGGDTGGNTGGNKDFHKKPAPSTIDAKVLSSVPMPKVKDLMDVPGLWATDKGFAKAQDYRITGFPADGGKKSWEIPLSGEICAGWRGVTEDNLTAVVYQDHKPKNKKDYAQCTEVGLVDLNAGKLVWHKHVGSGDSTLDFEEVTIGGGAVAAGGLDGGAGWSLSGKQLWTPTEGADCEDRGYFGSPDKLVGVTKCGLSEPTLKVVTVDPANGKPKSSFTMPPGIEYAHLVSADPLIVAFEAAGDSTDITDMWLIDDSGATGKLKTKIPLPSDKYSADCDATDVTPCTDVVVSKQTGTLFMSTKERSSAESGASNEILAISLKTGQSIGKADGVKESQITPLSLDKDGYLIAFQAGNYSQGPAIWRIDPTTYEKSLLMRSSAEDAEHTSRFATSRYWVVYRNDHLYLGDIYADELSDYDKNRPVAMVIGAG
ncbi:hypothetical protein ACZ90_40615 [Streptomyces albus subsp. albus]|nr:hypothetical protein ACZ90_40615 [Streptomyces albus subsp. albus]